MAVDADLDGVDGHPAQAVVAQVDDGQVGQTAEGAGRQLGDNVVVGVHLQEGKWKGIINWPAPTDIRSTEAEHKFMDAARQIVTTR